MGSAVTIFYYNETITKCDFSKSIKPAVISNEINDYREASYRVFKKFGGLYVIDYYKSADTHVRISFWNDNQGYSKWINDSDNAAYLQARKKYQLDQAIIDSLEGPFEAMMHD